MTTAVLPRLTQWRVRNLRRTGHLPAGAALLASVCTGPILGPGFIAAVQWMVVPVVVLSGITFWKWPRIHTMPHGWR
jgi:hypothetical protein